MLLILDHTFVHIVACLLFQRDEISANQVKKQKMQETINSKFWLSRLETFILFSP